MQDRAEWQPTGITGQNRNDSRSSARAEISAVAVWVDQGLGTQVDGGREDRDHCGRTQRAAEQIGDPGTGQSRGSGSMPGERIRGRAAGYCRIKD